MLQLSYGALKGPYGPLQSPYISPGADCLFLSPLTNYGQRPACSEPRGIGFVEFTHPKDAEECLDQMNGMTINGRTVRHHARHCAPIHAHYPSTTTTSASCCRSSSQLKVAASYTLCRDSDHAMEAWLHVSQCVRDVASLSWCCIHAASSACSMWRPYMCHAHHSIPNAPSAVCADRHERGHEGPQAP
jgi:hypothetical protein